MDKYNYDGRFMAIDASNTQGINDSGRLRAKIADAALMTTASLLIAGCLFVIFVDLTLEPVVDGPQEPGAVPDVGAHSCPGKATRDGNTAKALANQAPDKIIAAAKCAFSDRDFSDRDWFWVEAVLRPLAIQDSAPASLMLGEMYDPGRFQPSRPGDFPADYVAAFNCYRKAGAAGTTHIEILNRNANERSHAGDKRARRFLDGPISDGKCGLDVNARKAN